MRSLRALALLLPACHQTAETTPKEMPTIAEAAWLRQSLWDDGRSEISFYDAWTDKNGGHRTFPLATQLTKQSFDRAKQTKSDAGVADFKWTLFYETDSGSERFKFSYVANFDRADLLPLKVSANRFDWCSNQYRELAFTPQNDVRVLARSDDYGNSEDVIEYQPLSYPAVGVPLLVRAVDFSRMKQVDFSVVLLDGTYVDAMVELLGTERIPTGGGEVEAEKLLVHYAHEMESTFGPRITEELYWRGVDPARTLLQLRAQDGSYGMTLSETIRASYWSENIWERLARVKSSP